VDALRSGLRVPWGTGLVGGGEGTKGLPFPSPRQGPRAELAFPDWAWAAPPPGPSPRDRADRRWRLRPALSARWTSPIFKRR
jgi:hypothetical protein